MFFSGLRLLSLLHPAKDIIYELKCRNMKKIEPITLAQLKPRIPAFVENILDCPENTTLERFPQRLEAMGIVRDRPIEVLRQAKFGGLLHIRVGTTTELAIRPQEAQYITVMPIQQGDLP